MAISKAIEFGFDTVSCASTGNLANSVSAHAARAGLDCFIFIPDDLEQGKIIGSAIYGPRTVAIRGNYDDVNRLCSEIADKYRWAFVNINIRPYYTEGAKTYGFEIAEQLGWTAAAAHRRARPPAARSCPRSPRPSASCADVGLVDAPLPKIYSAQAAGCAPVVHAHAPRHRSDRAGEAEHDRQVDRHRQSGRRLLRAEGACGSRAVGAEAATDEEIVDAIQLLARTEGIFTEPAGGTTVAVTKKLIEQGRIPRDESIVISVTGNGYKTLEAVQRHASRRPFVINARLQEFDASLRLSSRRRRAAPPARRVTWRHRSRRIPCRKVRIPTPLRRFTGGAEEVGAAGATVGAVVNDLERQFPGIKERLCDEEGRVRRFVNIYLNGDDIRFLSNLETAVKDGDELSIVPAIAGG